MKAKDATIEVFTPAGPEMLMNPDLYSFEKRDLK